MRVTEGAKSCIRWWLHSLDSAFQYVSERNPDIHINCDNSLKVCGAKMISGDIFTQGVWAKEEQNLHINMLELKACKLGLMALVNDKTNIHVRLLTDNTTTCSYINKFGGRKTDLGSIARDLWFWCIKQNIYVSAAHIPGSTNLQADALSRSFKDDLEWSLVDGSFGILRLRYPYMEIDMFASTLNAKLTKYVSFYPDHEALATDAFSIAWDNKGLLYMFPPFSLIPRVLQKIQSDSAEAVLVAPVWKTQSWWPIMMKLLCQDWHLIHNAPAKLHLHHKPGTKHPIKPLKLGVFRISGGHLGNKTSHMSHVTL